MPPLAFSSASASWAPRCMSAARAPKGPVRGRGTPMRIGSLLCACRTAGKARVAAPSVVVVRKERRSMGDLLVCECILGQCEPSERGHDRWRSPDVSNPSGAGRAARARAATVLLLAALRFPFRLGARRGIPLDQLDGRLALGVGRVGRGGALAEALL